MVGRQSAILVHPATTILTIAGGFSIIAEWTANVINTKYTEINETNMETIANGAFQLSYLMTDAGEEKHTAFFATTTLLESKSGSFHILSIDGSPVAYALMGFGSPENPSIRRLSYFAVVRHERNKGFAKQAINLLIKEEADLAKGISVSCHPELQDFYEQFGFEFACISEDCNEEYISMALVDHKETTVEECVSKEIATFKPNPDCPQRFAKIRKDLRKMGIKPPMNAKSKKH
ncbi:GNAT family N-acetyltransferase [Photobacterium damselae]|uniref:GNAT family N-acetyltransferase n=1 Tax=Photobacterium damselae TaxID=38293 RepID=UPI00406801A7